MQRFDKTRDLTASAIVGCSFFRFVVTVSLQLAVSELTIALKSKDMLSKRSLIGLSTIIYDLARTRSSDHGVQLQHTLRFLKKKKIIIVLLLWFSYYRTERSVCLYLFITILQKQLHLPS